MIVVFYLFFQISDCDALLDGICYKAYQESQTWYDANDTCIHDGGNLVTVCNEGTNTMLKRIMQKQGTSYILMLYNYKQYLKTQCYLPTHETLGLIIAEIL